MPKITVQKISRKAKQIRRKGEEWKSAIKRASAELRKEFGTVKHAGARRSSKPGRKTVPKKKGYKPRKPIHQTGHSSKKIDERVKAKAPGKRKAKSGKVYYEYRKNRSDMPGRMTGMSKAIDGSAYREMILGHMRDVERARQAAEKDILHLAHQKRNIPRSEKLRRKMIDARISELKKFIGTQKKEMSMLKALYK